MELASVFPNGVRVTPIVDPFIRRIHHFRLRFDPLRQTERQFIRDQITHYDRGHRTLHSAISCSRRTEKEDGLSTSEGQRINSQAHDGVDFVKITHTSHPAGSEEAGISISASANYGSSIKIVAFWVSTALAFGIGLGLKDGVGRASEFFAGYLLEQSLSVDNLFVFVLIFNFFKVPTMYQGRVLTYGIAGAIVFRLCIILLGTATLQKSEAVNLLLAGILLFSSFKLFTSDDDDTDLSSNFVVKACQKVIPVSADYDGDKFITIRDGVWKATPLLLTLAVIELSDIAFAVDSIPAVLGVTRDPFIVFSSNLFAILGLRSVYVLISEGMADLEYLQPSIGVVLGYIGCKMILDYFGFHISTEVSLGLVATTLSTGVFFSLMKKSNQED